MWAARSALSEVFVLDRDSRAADRSWDLAADRSFRRWTDPPEPPERRRLERRATTGRRTHSSARRPRRIIPQEVWSELSGAEILRRQLAGELPPPPLHHLTGLRLTEVGEGLGRPSPCPRTEWLASPSRRLQGGVIAMQADFAMLGCGRDEAAPAGLAFAGLDLKTNFLRPVEPDDGDLVARGEVSTPGGRSRSPGRPVTNAGGQDRDAGDGLVHVPARPAGEPRRGGRAE